MFILLFFTGKPKKITKRNDPDCRPKGMECHVMKNDHWKTEPRWTCMYELQDLDSLYYLILIINKSAKWQHGRHTLICKKILIKKT